MDQPVTHMAPLSEADKSFGGRDKEFNFSLGGKEPDRAQPYNIHYKTTLHLPILYPSIFPYVAGELQIAV